ncbi:hypothetical protein MKW94_030626 [Papaver nudicaule]|uniref:RING-type E3 ubiquitin transferase n=1 Tax=Papaver nudicaule TaxID=74823 RepID=A0AA41VU91_PAPNU|nr:hypothetical protein [Papaver nudicaule]
MEDFVTPSKTQMNLKTICSVNEEEEEEEEKEDCSICFEPFTSDDPSAVTKCKHEYHLQCILEWSQRSKECPICWQLLVLKDSSSQELLAAVEIERTSRSRRGSSNTSIVRQISFEDIESSHVGSYADESEFDENIVQHLAASAMGRIHHFRRRENRRSDVDRDIYLGFASPSNGSEFEHAYNNSPVRSQNLGNLVSHEVNSATSAMAFERSNQPSSTVLLSCLHTGSNISENRHDPPRPSIFSAETPPSSPRRSRPSDFLSLSESFKSRFSAASSRYKESISKSTRGIKEKLLSRNNSVKEVQREVTAGISRMALLMERLDPISKRAGPSSGSFTSDTVGTSESLHNRKVMPDSLTSHSRRTNDAKIVQSTSSNASVFRSGNVSSKPGQMRVTRVQDFL